MSDHGTVDTGDITCPPFASDDEPEVVGPDHEDEGAAVVMSEERSGDGEEQPVADSGSSDNACKEVPDEGIGGSQPVSEPGSPGAAAEQHDQEDSVDDQSAQEEQKLEEAAAQATVDTDSQAAGVAVAGSRSSTIPGAVESQRARSASDDDVSKRVSRDRSDSGGRVRSGSGSLSAALSSNNPLSSLSTSLGISRERKNALVETFEEFQAFLSREVESLADRRIIPIELFQKLVAQSNTAAPTSALIQALFGLLTAVDISQRKNIIPLLFQLLRFCTREDKIFLLSKFCSHVATSTANVVACSSAKLMELLLEIIYVVDNSDSEVMDALGKLIVILGKYSTSVRELKLIFDGLKLNVKGEWPQMSNFLLKSLLEISKPVGPEQFFDFDGRTSGLELPDIADWPAHGFTFSTWVRIESFEDPTNRQNYEPRLLSCFTESGQGFEVFWPTPDPQAPGVHPLMLRVFSDPKKGEASFLNFDFQPRRWYCVTVSLRKASSFHPGTVKLFVDGEERARESSRYPSLAQPLTRCRIATNMPLRDQHARDCPFFGQLGALYLFSKDITKEQARTIYVLGPHYIYTFQPTDPINQRPVANLNDSLNNSISVLPDFPELDGQLTSKIFLAYNPKMCTGSTCVDTTPESNGRLIGWPGKMCVGTSCCLLKQAKDVIHSLGGIKILFPLFANAAAPVVGDTEGEVHLLPVLFDVLGEMLRDSESNREEMIRLEGFSIISSILKSMSPKMLTFPVVACMHKLVASLALCDFHCSSPDPSDTALAGEKIMFNEAFLSLLLDPGLWVFTAHAVHLSLLALVKSYVERRPMYFQKLVGIQKFLDLLRMFYWYSSEPFSQAKSDPSTGRVRPAPEEISELRMELLSMLKKIFVTSFSKEDVYAFFFFFEENRMDQMQLPDVLRTFHQACVGSRQVDRVAKHISKKGGVRLLLPLLRLEHEAIRVEALKLIGTLILANLPPLHSSGSPKRPFFYHITDALFAYQSSSEIFNALLLCLVGQSHMDHLELDGTQVFRSPEMLQVIFKLLLTTPQTLRQEVLQNINVLLQTQEANRVAFLAIDNWQDLLLGLILDNSSTDSNSVVHEFLGNMFQILHYQLIRHQKDGWKDVEKTLTCIRARVESGLVEEMMALSLDDAAEPHVGSRLKNPAFALLKGLLVYIRREAHFFAKEFKFWLAEEIKRAKQLSTASYSLQAHLPAAVTGSPSRGASASNASDSGSRVSAAGSFLGSLFQGARALGERKVRNLAKRTSNVGQRTASGIIKSIDAARKSATGSLSSRDPPQNTIPPGPGLDRKKDDLDVFLHNLCHLVMIVEEMLYNYRSSSSLVEEYVHIESQETDVISEPVVDSPSTPERRPDYAGATPSSLFNTDRGFVMLWDSNTGKWLHMELVVILMDILELLNVVFISDFSKLLPSSSSSLRKGGILRVVIRMLMSAVREPTPSICSIMTGKLLFVLDKKCDSQSERDRRVLYVLAELLQVVKHMKAQLSVSAKSDDRPPQSSEPSEEGRSSPSPSLSPNPNPSPTDDPSWDPLGVQKAKTTDAVEGEGPPCLFGDEEGEDNEESDKDEETDEEDSEKCLQECVTTLISTVQKICIDHKPFQVISTSIIRQAESSVPANADQEFFASYMVPSEDLFESERMNPQEILQAILQVSLNDRRRQANQASRDERYEYVVIQHLDVAVQKVVEMERSFKSVIVQRGNEALQAQKAAAIAAAEDATKAAKFLSECVQLQQLHCYSEVNRSAVVSSSIEKEARRRERLWQRTYHQLTQERGPWSIADSIQLVGDRVFWKLNKAEDCHRMRRRLKRNWRGSDHRDASHFYDQAPEFSTDELKKFKVERPASQAQDEIIAEEDEEEDGTRGDMDIDAEGDSPKKASADNRDSKGSTADGDYCIVSPTDRTPTRPSSSSSPLTSPRWDRSLSVATLPEEKPFYTVTCELITPLVRTPGKLEISPAAIVFRADRSIPQQPSGGWGDAPPPRDYKDRRWLSKDMKTVYKRRYLLRRSALEIFFGNGKAYFFNLTAKTCNTTYKKLLAVKSKSFVTPSSFKVDGETTVRWQRREISNFDYLMYLNTMAGRTYNDLTQYPVFPWILNDYSSETIDLKDPAVYRDLSKPIGALNPDRLKQILDRYESFDDQDIPKFHYGTHYSSAAAVLFYLLRLEPFTSLHVALQSGKFDVADRLFASVAEVWNNCNISLSDVKELVPEFFYMPEFLENNSRYDLGVMQTGRRVDDVELPPWASSPEEFIRINRDALESDYVSEHLNEWIDLIFGAKQQGDAAIEAYNVFYYLTYEGRVDLDSIKDPVMQKAIEVQIANFGQTPFQLTTKSHPKRFPVTAVAHYRPFLYPPLSLVDCVGQTVSATIGKEPALFVQAHLDHSKCTVISKSREVCHATWKRTRQSGVEKTDSSLYIDPRYQNANSQRRIGCPFALDLEPTHKLFAMKQDGVGSNCVVVCGFWDCSVKVVALENGQAETVQSVFEHKDVVTCVAVDSHGKRVMTGSRDTTAMIWGMELHHKKPMRLSEKPHHVLYGHDDEVNCVAMCSTQDLALSGSKDGTVVVHTIWEGRYVRTIVHPKLSPIDQLEVTDRGDIVAYSKDDATLFVFSVNGKLIHVFPSDVGPISCMRSVVTFQDTLLVYCGRGAAVLKLNKLEMVHRLDDIGQPVTSMWISPDGRHMMFGTKWGKVWVLNLDSRQ